MARNEDKEINHFTIAAAEKNSTYLLVHLESGQQWVISREELKHLYEACSHWVRERESQ